MPMLAEMPLSKAARMSRSRWLAQRNRKTQSRATALAVGVHGWLEKLARARLREVNERLRKGGIHGLKRSRLAKAFPDFNNLEMELFHLLTKYGLAQLDAAAKDSAGTVGHTWVIPRTLMDRKNQEIANKVVLLIDQTDELVRQSIKNAVSEALSETPRPSARELGRRIARQWMGPPHMATDKPHIGLRGTAEELRHTADWRRSQEELDEGRENIFSFARAATIARTEIAQAENAGIAEGLADAGVEKVGWLAHGNDGRSEGRRHYLMNRHKAITVKAMKGRKRSEWFKLPSGARAPYPNWIGLPAGETVNCRCVLVPRR